MKHSEELVEAAKSQKSPAENRAVFALLAIELRLGEIVTELQRFNREKNAVRPGHQPPEET